MRPILACIGIGAILTLIMVFSNNELTSVAIFPESWGGPLAPLYGLLSALLLLGIGIAGGLFILFLLKSDREKLLRRIFMIMFGFTTAVMTFFFLYMLYSGIPFILPLHPFVYLIGDLVITIIIIGASTTIGYFVAKYLFSEDSSQLQKNICLLYLGGGLGAFLGVFLPTWTALIMLAFFSLWDIYAVKKGPIKEMIEYWEKDEEKKEIDVHFSDPDDMEIEYQIGIGDLVFYTLLTSHVLNISVGTEPFGTTFFYFLRAFPFPLNIIVPLIPFFLVLIGVIIGAEITFRILVKSGKIMPGLPLSVAFGVGLFGLSCVLIFFASILI